MTLVASLAMTRFVDTHVDLDSQRERIVEALSPMAWNDERQQESAEPPAEAEPLDDGPLVVHTVSDDDPPG